MRVLITGMRGAAGSYLADYLYENEPDVGCRGLSIESDPVNLLHYSRLEVLIALYRPDRIFHFASMANIRESFSDSKTFLENNIIGTANLFEVCRTYVPEARILMVSSCEVYGPPQTSQMPENHPFNPMSPYAVSKAAQDQMARMYAKVYGMHIVTSRLFNCVNPRRADLFTTSFARQIAEIEAGKRTELVHGDLDSARTLYDVRDVVRGYWDLLEHGEPGEAYNIGASDEVSVNDILNRLIQRATVNIPTRQDPSLLRPVDIRTQIADQSKFLKCTGWEPQYTLNESLDWLLEEARKNV